MEVSFYVLVLVSLYFLYLLLNRKLLKNIGIERQRGGIVYMNNITFCHILHIKSILNRE